MKINIAIDGLAGSGKSTVAKIVASKLGYNYIDTGSMYRCVAYLVLENHIDPLDELKMQELLENHFNYEYQDSKVKLNGEDVTLKIREDRINEILPQIVPLPEVRKFLVKKQQKMGEKKGVIMDGRDIGSVVLKDAELKIYQTASLESRAKRRYKENLEKGLNSKYEDIYNNLKYRDYVDTHVSKALVKVKDAIELDTTNMGIDEVVNEILRLVETRIKHD